MLNELFVSNLARATVIHGGMDEPAPGSVQTLTVKSSDGWPRVRRNVEQFHFKDGNPERGSELFRCIETNGVNWTVVRGSGGTEPVPHSRNFSIRQIVPAEFFHHLGGGSTTELVNAVTVFDADPTGEEPTTDKLHAALDSGPVYIPTGTYRLDKPLNVLPGSVIISFGRVTLKADPKLAGDAAIELVDGDGQTRIENITLDGSALGAGTNIYGIFAETRRLEAELRSIRIHGFPNSGFIGSGSGWVLDRVTCRQNYGSGFEINFIDTLWLGCRAIGNSRYGFIGSWGGEPIGCIAHDNKLGDFRLAGL